MKTKSEIRKEMLSLRKSMSIEEAAEKSKSIIMKLKGTNEYKKAHNIMIYMDFKNEVNTKKLIKQLLKSDKSVIIPYTDIENTEVIPVKIDSMDKLVYSKYGYLEPSQEMLTNPFDKRYIDLVVVPGVAFDKNRNRIGFGKGYYDKLLNSVREDTKSIALAYDFQVLDEIPAQEHDIKMDKIITESTIID